MDELTTTISPLVIDLVIAAIILLVACLKAKAGLFQGVMSIVVIILSLAIGLVGAKLCTPMAKEYVWEKYYKPQAEERFDSQVDAALEGDESIQQTFKRNWNKMITSLGVDELSVLKISEDEVDYSDSDLVAKLRQLALMKAELLAEKVTHLALFGLFTAVGLLLLTLLKNLLDKVANFSIIGWVNHAGGFVLGLIEILVIMIVIVRGAGLLNIHVFEDLSQGTVLLKWLVGGDVQGSINAIQNLTLEDLKNIKLEDLTTVDLKDVGSQLKELVENVDLSEAPEQVQELLENVDVEGITESVKETVEGIDVQGLTDKAKDLAGDAAKDTGEAAKSKLMEILKEGFN